MAKKADEAMKITSIEKLLYTLEEKDKTINNMRIEFERDSFELSKQLYDAKSEITQLKTTISEQTTQENELLLKIKKLKGENELLRPNLLSNTADSKDTNNSNSKTSNFFSNRNANTSNKQSNNDDNTNLNSNADNNINSGASIKSQATPSSTSESKKSGFSFGGMFSRK